MEEITTLSCPSESAFGFVKITLPHLSFKVCVLELTWPLACCVIKGRSFNLSGPVFSSLKWAEIPWRSLLSHRRRQHREHHFLSLNPEAVDSVKFLEVAYLNRSKKDRPAPRAERAWGMGAWVEVFPTSVCDPWLLLMRMENKSKQFQAKWDSGTSQLTPGKAEDNSIAPTQRVLSQCLQNTLRRGWMVYLGVQTPRYKILWTYFHNLKRKN